MPLPPLDNLTALDWLRLADNPEKIAQLLLVARMADREPQSNELLAHELVWLSRVGLNGEPLLWALTDLSPGDIIQLWVEKNPHLREKRRGNTPSLLYELARIRLENGGKSKMEVYRDLVRPGLIELGELKADENGEPDPEQDKAAIKKYLKAMSRRGSPRK